MWIFLVFHSHIFTVVSMNALTAPVGGNVTFHCSHLMARGNIKYFCRDSCAVENILIKTNAGANPTRRGRYTIHDKGSDFTVTITDLRLSDSATYICAVERLLIDTYTYGTRLHVFQENKGTSMTKRSTADSSPETMHRSALSVVVGAPVTVTGYRGERADIRCPYESGYESNSKYLCKGECRDRNIIVKSGSPAEDQRFSLRDDTTARVFTVTITDLRSADEGRYWCGVERSVIKDVYSEIMLLVKQGK
ncbi:uncharacterized protein LOC132142860 [Carassius carassius]|uniref:uncharacterized protein LOC132142860 n=1 Tax=Carassius carassius TaxID=217509 RepID=UPI0028695591|nr:uncharacterized protein LOC132142860 [Carassius carassius]